MIRRPALVAQARQTKSKTLFHMALYRRAYTPAPGGPQNRVPSTQSDGHDMGAMLLSHAKDARESEGLNALLPLEAKEAFGVFSQETAPRRERHIL